MTRGRRAAAIGAAVAAQALAAPLIGWAADVRAAAVRSVSECRRIADDGARLACYDKTAAGLDDAEARGEIVVMDRAQAQAARRQAFGLPLPSLDILSRTLKPDEADSIEGVATAARPDASGRWTLTLEDGAVWRQIDGDLARPPRQGSKVRIRHGALGSFLMNVDGQPAVKAHRDR